MTDSSLPAVALIAEGMARFRDEMEANDRFSREISAKTKKIVRGAGLALVATAVVVIVQILAMRSELMVMIENLDDMYRQFQVMGGNLDTMTNQVGSIGARVSELPSIAGDMSAINHEMGGIRRAVGAMTNNVSAMTTDTTVLRDITGEMAQHFREVEQTVGYLNYNVGQMMRPMSMIPR